ncbi:hypothetical protein SEA_GAGE_68 [Mycobacterium phage Gage]|uniref:Uncharacterized protein n=1 Tax=Mycobacterium phage 244 TaxID=2902792 RepID=Q1A104_9CAUD|nr:gp67 [Mycobacterium phage 244]AVE00110.1 hypothetical protein SEA_KIMCHI_70 [Mycobacterium phage Kimchi]AVI03962.1 hypothetical protein SEA_GAGE_68 [Mycobacterium phage Gage]AYD83782.1 hypothetical protein SEA_GEMINI_71 [Mycobacterium phage Gemini]QGJ94243.1 hypothetical protein SEA_HOONTER_69 [Mycobacterium phage Hoonter]QGJ94599.1 hypothetical protein SEA_GOOBERAZURE_69 [Mycobacterium phage GooberAzure]QGJ95376.1 hypothetical protein SEA_BUCK_67 [Mycobacterium phage Buck]QGJ95521.1 hypo
MSAIDILEKAKALAPEKWLPHHLLGLPGEPCCILGLVGYAAFGDDWKPSYGSLELNPDARVAVEYLAAVSSSTSGEDDQEKVYLHNDTYLRTVKQVQSFIDQAIWNARG